MTNFKGTKGKWVIDSSPNNGVITILSKTAYICDVDFDKEGEANALLISKAPQMLEMLENCFGMLDKIRPATEEEMREMKNNIKKLIKEATEL